jgi:DNA anti-recombination protein RmuC
MAMMARETWTDERLDDLNGRVSEGFAGLSGDITKLRDEMDRGSTQLRVEMNNGFTELRREMNDLRREMNDNMSEFRREMNELRRETNERFDAMHRTMVRAFIATSGISVTCFVAFASLSAG